MRTLMTLPLGIALLVSPLAARAQPAAPLSPLAEPLGPPPIAARQARPDEVGYQVVASPMLLEISLGASPGRRSFKDADPRYPWLVTETAAFVCEGARLETVQVTRERLHPPGIVDLKILAHLAPEVPGRTIGLTVAIVSNGREIRRQFERVDTTGATTRGAVIRPSNPSAEFEIELGEQEFAAMFAGARAPILRIILDV
jgi:hypothetical protein